MFLGNPFPLIDKKKTCTPQRLPKIGKCLCGHSGRIFHVLSKNCEKCVYYESNFNMPIIVMYCLQFGKNQYSYNYTKDSFKFVTFGLAEREAAPFLYYTF